MECSLKVQPTVKDVLNVSLKPSGPGDANCAAQIAHVHPLKHSEEKYNEHQLNTNMRILRNREGLHAPLKLSMELHSAKKIGRLPILSSSNAQLDVLLGRDELIEFSDFLGTEDFSEHLRHPHAVIEKSLGIL